MKKIIAALFCLFLVTAVSAQTEPNTAPPQSSTEHVHSEAHKEKHEGCKKGKEGCTHKDKASCSGKKDEKQCKKKCKKKCKKDKIEKDSIKGSN